MIQLVRALKPVRKRMRIQRVFMWTIVGIFAGAIGVLLLRGASFMWEIPTVTAWYLATIFATPLLFGLTAWLLPISDMTAARQADACGLHARAQTALMLKDSATPMADLQREDTLESLSRFTPQEMLPLTVPKSAIVGVLVCTVLFSASFLIPNPQVQILHAKTEFQTEMKKQADLVEDGATMLDDKEAQTQDLRKLLGDLAHALRKSTDPKTALSALDEAERKMTNIQKATAKETQESLKAAGMKELAKALEEGDTDKAKSLLNNANAQSAADQLAEAASNAADQTTSQQLTAAAQAMSSGNSAEALEALQSAATGQTSALAQANALSAMARSAAAQAGAKQAASLQLSGLNPSALGMIGTGSMNTSSLGSLSGSGNSQAAGSGNGSGGSSSGMGSGGGAGTGTSNQDGGYSNAGGSTAAAGKNAAETKIGTYESIYDPTRLGVEGIQTNERGRLGEGDVSEVTIGSGVGTIDEGVPYNEVLPEYYNSAVEAVQNANLPTYAQKWVDSYFSSLSE